MNSAKKHCPFQESNLLTKKLKNFSDFLPNAIFFNLTSEKKNALHSFYQCFLCHYSNFIMNNQCKIVRYSNREDDFSNSFIFFEKIAMITLLRQELKNFNAEIEMLIKEKNSIEIDEKKLAIFIRKFETKYIISQIITLISTEYSARNFFSLFTNEVYQPTYDNPFDFEFENFIVSGLKNSAKREIILKKILKLCAKNQSSNIFNQIILLIVTKFFLLMLKENKVGIDDVFDFLKDSLRSFFEATKNLSEEVKNSFGVYLKGFVPALISVLEGNLTNILFFEDSFPRSNNLEMINPCLLSIDYYFHTLTNNENKENKISLSRIFQKITFLNMDGYENDLNLGIFKNSAQTLQYISIYLDDNDNFNVTDQIMETFNESKDEKNSILIPLRSKRYGVDDKIKGKEFLYLFENIVDKKISKFKPSLIVISHSFSFSSYFDNNHKFDISPKKFARIIRNLCKISNYKIILCPRIIFQTKNLIIDHNSNKIKDENDEIFHKIQSKFIYSENAWRNNRNYIYDMFAGFLNIANRNTDFMINTKNSNIMKNVCFMNYVQNLIKKLYQTNCLFQKRLKMKGMEENLRLKALMRLKNFDHALQEPIIKLKWNMKQVMMEENFMNCTISIFDELKLENKVYKLFKKENEPFYYSKDSRYLVAYDMKVIFFFNVFMDQKFQNFKFEFSMNSLDLYALNIKDYPKEFNHPKTVLKLEDFSLCYESQRNIYLIWGQWIFAKDTKEILNETLLNPYIFKFSCEKNDWEKITLITDPKIPIFPRLKVTSCLINEPTRKTIYLFSGYGDNDPYYNNIYNIIEKVDINMDKPFWNYYKIPKEMYRSIYQPQIGSYAIDYNSFKTKENKEKDTILLIGGYFNSYVNPKLNKGLNILKIVYNKKIKQIFISDKSKKFKSYLMENIYFSSQNMNYFCNKLRNNLFFILQISPKEKKEFQMELLSSTCEKMRREHENNTKFVILAKIDFESRRCEIKKEIEILRDKHKQINKFKTLDSMKIFQNSSFNYILNERKSEIYIFSKGVNYGMLSFTELNFGNLKTIIKRSKYLKSTNYCCYENQVYILINNENDTQCGRNIYRLQMDQTLTIKKNSTLLPFLLESQNLNIIDCSIYCEGEKFLCFGGCISDPLKQIHFETENIFQQQSFQTNFYYIEKNIRIYFKSNLAEMRNPFVRKFENYFIVINSSIVNQISKITFLELARTPQWSKNVFQRKGSFIYGESIDDQFKEDWTPFIINLNNAEALNLDRNMAMELETNNKKYKGKLKNVCSTKKSMYFLVPFNNENHRFLKNKIKVEFMKVNIEKLMSSLRKNENLKDLVKFFSLKECINHRYDDLLAPITNSSDCDDENISERILFFEGFDRSKKDNSVKLKNFVNFD